MPSLAPAYCRQPALQGDTVVFVSDDDLWRADVQGGVARRLTNGLSEPATPALSPCGQWLAYTGRDEQHAEVWLMPAIGGPARRLTWLGSDLAVRGFTPEGQILFVSNHGQPFFRNWHAYTLPLGGGQPARIPLGNIHHLAWGPQGRRVIGRHTADPARWKRYRGGTAGHLWVEDAACSGRFRRMRTLQGNLGAPMWLQGRIHFISDFEGIGNLYSCLPDGSELRCHTRHDTYFARHAASDGQRIVYQHAAQIWLFDPVSGQSRPLEIEVPSARTQAARRAVPVAEHLHGMALHPAGHSLVLEARGQVFTMGLWDGAVRQHGAAAARRRLAHWLADGQTLVACSDASGEERVEVLAGNETREPAWVPTDLGRITALRPAPRGTQVALANHRNELWVGDVASGALQRVAHSDYGRIEDPAWSPCGGWLAFTLPTSTRHAAIALHRLTDGSQWLATEPEFRDYCPAFSPCGRYLYFLSYRSFDPVYDSVQFELSFPRAARPYLIALQAGGAPPFEPEPRAPGEAEEGADVAALAAAAAAVAPRGGEPAANPLPAIDPEGLARRVAAFPVPEGRYGQVAGVARGKVVWTLLPIAGAHGRGGHKEGPGRLEVFSFDRCEVQTLAAQADSFVLAADARSLLLRCAAQVRAIDASRKPGGPAGGKGGDSAGVLASSGSACPAARPGPASGFIDLARVRLSVNPPQEWAQMLAEVWRLQRDHFWVADMSGVDWPAMRQRYAALLPRVATRGELSDLIWELQGELGTSHAYETGGDHRKPPAVALGHLAADLRPAVGSPGWEIVRTVQGDPWDAAADSPLNAVGVQAQPGERLLAVGGQAVTPALPPQALLLQHAGAKVSLTLAGADGRVREVLVTALADETPARYREWVERNRAWVHTASGGRVGYFHLPDMMSAGFAEFHRYFGTECDRDALIVDVRYNRGGHVSQLLLEKVARKRVAWCLQRWGRPTAYPEDSPAGAVVALTNEQAGSDGDIFSHNVKLMGIGPLVGQRTWGGVIGIWPRHKLIDGTETTQPEYAYWFRDVGWGVENHGTDPQVEVDNAPQDDAFNAPERDRQLATALAEALKGIERQGVARPDFGPRPHRGLRPKPGL